MNELCTTALSSPQVKSQELKDLSFVLQDIWHTQHQEPTRAAIVQGKNIFTALYVHYSVTLLPSSPNIVGCFSLDSIIFHSSHVSTLCSLNCLRFMWFMHLSVSYDFWWLSFNYSFLLIPLLIVVRVSGVPRNFVWGGGGSTNSVEDSENGDLGEVAP